MPPGGARSGAPTRRHTPSAAPGSSDLGAALDRGQDLGDRVVDRHPVLLRAVAVAERHGASGPVLLTRDERERHLGLARVADLLGEAVVARVQLDPNSLAPQS